MGSLQKKPDLFLSPQPLIYAASKEDGRTLFLIGEGTPSR
jgi:hypothetical protein